MSAPFGFTGELHSAGQVYLRARWYAPGQGRFVSEDPFAGFAEMPYSLHAYQYAYSNPVVWTDPTGENPLACVPIALVDSPVPGPADVVAGGCLVLVGGIWLVGTLVALTQRDAVADVGNSLVAPHTGHPAPAPPPLASGPPATSGDDIGACVVPGGTTLLPPDTGIWLGPSFIPQPWPFTTGAPLVSVQEPLVWMVRPGYSGPDQGYANNKPDDLQPGKPYKTLQEAMANPDVRPFIGEGGITYAAKYIYVITGQGEIRIASHKTHHHPDLVDGNNVYGAGQIFLDDAGTITSIDDQSGHYFPRDGTIFGPAFFDYMHYLLTQAGIVVSKDVFDTY